MQSTSSALIFKYLRQAFIEFRGIPTSFFLLTNLTSRKAANI